MDTRLIEKAKELRSAAWALHENFPWQKIAMFSAATLLEELAAAQQPPEADGANGAAWHGKAWQGVVGLGTAWPGKARYS